MTCLIWILGTFKFIIRASEHLHKEGCKMKVKQVKIDFYVTPEIKRYVFVI